MHGPSAPLGHRNPLVELSFVGAPPLTRPSFRFWSKGRNGDEQEPSSEGNEPGLRDVSERSPRRDEPISCRNCGAPITKDDERIQRNGRHRHTFSNPHGLIFEVGCFRSVTGCQIAGQPTDEHTWFSGYFWDCVFCRRCVTHLGWYFSNRKGTVSFYGLVLERLIEGKRTL